MKIKKLQNEPYNHYLILARNLKIRTHINIEVQNNNDTCTYVYV